MCNVDLSMRPFEELITTSEWGQPTRGNVAYAQLEFQQSGMTLGDLWAIVRCRLSCPHAQKSTRSLGCSEKTDLVQFAARREEDEFLTTGRFTKGE